MASGITLTQRRAELWGVSRGDLEGAEAEGVGRVVLTDSSK